MRAKLGAKPQREYRFVNLELVVAKDAIEAALEGKKLKIRVEHIHAAKAFSVKVTKELQRRANIEANKTWKAGRKAKEVSLEQVQLIHDNKNLPFSKLSRMVGLSITTTFNVLYGRHPKWTVGELAKYGIQIPPAKGEVVKRRPKQPYIAIANVMRIEPISISTEETGLEDGEGTQNPLSSSS